jgi:hypothetical protein
VVGSDRRDDVLVEGDSARGGGSLGGGPAARGGGEGGSCGRCVRAERKARCRGDPISGGRQHPFEGGWRGRSGGGSGEVRRHMEGHKGGGHDSHRRGIARVVRERLAAARAGGARARTVAGGAGSLMRGPGWQWEDAGERGAGRAWAGRGRKWSGPSTEKTRSGPGPDEQ